MRYHIFISAVFLLSSSPVVACELNILQQTGIDQHAKTFANRLAAGGIDRTIELDQIEIAGEDDRSLPRVPEAECFETAWHAERWGEIALLRAMRLAADPSAYTPQLKAQCNELVAQAHRYLTAAGTQLPVSLDVCR